MRSPTIEPKLVKGALAVDDRGTVSFVNDFSFEGVKRFYAIENHARGFVRAWHGHKEEAKYFFASKGAFLICATPVENWDRPSKSSEMFRFVLDEKCPALLFVPAGYAHGFISLTEDSKLVVFSTATLQDSLRDDFRFEARYWDPWSIQER
jgi:dTDP-4-dehydrorhamnose 3,5-epimerase-like enzyme